MITQNRRRSRADINGKAPAELTLVYPPNEESPVIRTATAILCACLTIGAAAQTTDEAARQGDVSAIYSALFLPIDPFYLIAERTSAGTGGFEIQSCITLPAQYAMDWAEILAAYNANRPGSTTIAPNLKLPRSYVLLNADEVTAFVNERMSTLARTIAPPVPNPKFKDAVNLYSFSDVYFNQSRTIAVTWANITAGPAAASQRWAPFEKVNGIWQERRQWNKCFRIA
jgi:hypothetical protein